VTKTLPSETLGALGLREGDTLRVLGAVGSSFLVSISHDEPAPLIRAPGGAAEWLKSARGSVKLAAGESADDARMEYYADKFGLRR
jgi:hypothetical protein